MPSRFTQYGGAAGAEMALKEMVAERLLAEAEQRKFQQQQLENDMKLRQIGQGDRRMDIEQEQFGQTHQLNLDKFGQEQAEFAAGAPERDARAGFLRTQTRDLEQKPMYQDAARAHDEKMANLGGALRMGQINRQGEIDAGLLRQRTDAAGASKPPEGPSPYAIQNTQRTIGAIEDLIGKPKKQPDGTFVFGGGRIGPMTAGPIGALMSNIGGTEAADVSADLSSVASNVAFKALQDMREASKTGGALGQVSERELDLLSAVEGSIRQNQSPENLRRNLQKIYESQQRWLAAAQGVGHPLGRPIEATMPGAPQGNGLRILSVEEVP